MKKIPSVFLRNHETDQRLRNEVTPGCEWVIAGEGIATRKWDGTACLIHDGKLFKRYDAKNGKTPPVGWEPCEPAPDVHTGHWPGWVLVGDRPEDKIYREASLDGLVDGTYELVGPRINRNPDRFSHAALIRHGINIFHAVPRTFDGLVEWCRAAWVEGIVFHHLDGRMAKVKRRDFGFEWPPRGDAAIVDRCDK